MWLNIIDYRGDNTVINSRGESLFNYRTRYFLRQQQEFARWKEHGHKFRCWTQHDRAESLWEEDEYFGFDDVVRIPRSNAATARNQVLDYYGDEWIGIWDNDTTMYWHQLQTAKTPKLLHRICSRAEHRGLIAWVPFNPHAAPYRYNATKLFNPTVQMKGTMMFMRDVGLRFDETIDVLEDIDFACAATFKGYKIGICELVALKEFVNGKSTIFSVDAHHKDYKHGQALKWDAKLDRRARYDAAKQVIQQRYGKTVGEVAAQQRKMW